jgi:hypothetical protein
MTNFLLSLSAAVLLTLVATSPALAQKRDGAAKCHTCVQQCHACGWVYGNCESKCKPKTLMVRKDSGCVPGQQFSTKGC